MELCEKTIKNLTKIKNELPLLAFKIPEIISDFDMLNYGCYKNVSKDKINNDNVCKTYGCGLGNTARLFDLNKEEYFWHSGFNYDLFCKDILPSLYMSYSYEDLDTNVNECWYYLFSAQWGLTSYNCFSSFIYRIENLLNHGKLINSFDLETNKIIN